MPAVLVVVPVVLLLLMLLLVAVRVIEGMLGPAAAVPAFPRAPFTWGDIVHQLASGLQGAISWLDNAIMPALHALWAWVSSHERFLQGHSLHAEAVTNALGRVVHIKLPGVLGSAQAFASQLYQQAIAYANAVDADATRKAAAAELGAEQYAQQLANTVDQHAVQLAQVAEVYARQEAVAAEQYAQQLAQGAEAFAQSIGNDVIAYAHQGLLDADQFAQQVGQAATAYIDQVATTLRRALGQAEQAGFADTRAVVGAAVAPLSAALAGTQAAVQELERSECMKFCAPLGGLGAGLDLLELAALVAFLAGVAANPDGAARVIEDGFADAATAAVGIVDQLLGVKARAA